MMENNVLRNTPKGAIVFLLQEIGRMSPREIQKYSKEIFGFDMDAHTLLTNLKHLQDRNIISVCGNGKRTEYKVRKVRFGELEMGQITDLIGTEDILRRKFQEWKEKISG